MVRYLVQVLVCNVELHAAVGLGVADLGEDGRAVRGCEFVDGGAKLSRGVW